MSTSENDHTYPLVYLAEEDLLTLKEREDDLMQYIALFWSEVLRSPMNQKVECPSQLVLLVTLEPDYHSNIVKEVCLRVEIYPDGYLHEHVVPLPRFETTTPSELLLDLSSLMISTGLSYDCERESFEESDAMEYIDPDTMFDYLLDRCLKVF